MPNKARLKSSGNSNVNIRQSDSAKIGTQNARVTSSDFDEVRAKLRQLGKGDQKLSITSPMFGRHRFVVRRTKNGRRI